jgi:LmbE family N-acetylglucosaminyl deacetylase
MKSVVVVAPHPDDETLGCAGTLLRHIEEGDHVHWVIITDMAASTNFSQIQIDSRKLEIAEVAKRFGFRSITQLAFAPAKLTEDDKSLLIGELADKLKALAANIVYLPYKFDVHSDHQIVADCVVSATKRFRQPSIESLFVYETLSETDYNLTPQQIFSPNYFVDISPFIKEKIAIMQCYQSELLAFPFPRSIKAIEALASVRGAQAYVEAAEAFILLKQVR